MVLSGLNIDLLVSEHCIAIRDFFVSGKGRLLCQSCVYLPSGKESTKDLFSHAVVHTVNPLYTDTQYNDKIGYNDKNLNATKPSLKK